MGNCMTQRGGLSAQDRATVETFYRAFAGEPDLLDRVVAPGWQDVPLAPGQGPGPEGIKPMIQGFKAAIPDLAIIVHDVIAEGGRIGVRAEIAGTHADVWFGVLTQWPALLGRAARVPPHRERPSHHTWHLEDWFGWLNQVGAWPNSKENA